MSQNSKKEAKSPMEEQLCLLSQGLNWSQVKTCPRAGAPNTWPLCTSEEPPPSTLPSNESTSLHGPRSSRAWQASCFLPPHTGTHTCIFSPGMYFQGALMCFYPLESIWAPRRLPAKSWEKFYPHLVWPHPQIHDLTKCKFDHILLLFEDFQSKNLKT